MDEDVWHCKRYGLSVSPALTGKRQCVAMWKEAIADEDHFTHTKCVTCDLGAFYEALLEDDVAKKCCGWPENTVCEKGAIKEGLCSKHFRLKNGYGIHDTPPGKEIPVDLKPGPLEYTPTTAKELLKPGQHIIDFFGMDDLHDKVQEMAREDLRTFEMQVLWLVKKQVKFLSTVYLGGREAKEAIHETVGGSGTAKAADAGS